MKEGLTEIIRSAVLVLSLNHALWYSTTHG